MKTATPMRIEYVDIESLHPTCSTNRSSRVGVDNFFAVLPRRMFGATAFEPAPGGGYRPIIALRDAIRPPMPGALAAIAATNDLIVDDVVNGSEWLRSIVRALAPFTVLFVGSLSLEELERREAARGDRRAGIARGMLGLVHEHELYDFTVDTSMMTSAECADAIKDSYRWSDFETFPRTLATVPGTRLSSPHELRAGDSCGSARQAACGVVG